MATKLYSCGMMENLREREMMKSLVRSLMERYRDYDDCTILVEPEYRDEQFGFSHKPDCIIFKDNTIIVLELKTWNGEFEIDLESHTWKAKGNRKLQTYIDNLREQPDVQCVRYSEALKELLLNKFSQEFLPDKYQKGEVENSQTKVHWAKVLREYVLLKPGSTIQVSSLSFDPRPRIICADKLPNEISQIRKEQKWLPDSVIDELISIFHGRETDIDHLFSKPNPIEGEDTLESVRDYVSNLLSSSEVDNVLTGLELSSSMKLKSLYYRILDIYTVSEITKVRINALKSIISLNQSNLSYLFSVGLSKGNSELREYILDLLIKYPYFPGISTTLENLVNSSDLDIAYKSIKALSLNKTSRSCDFFVTLLEEICEYKPYLSVYTLSKLEDKAREIRDSDKEIRRKQFYSHKEIHLEKRVYVDSCISCKEDRVHKELVGKHVKAVALIEALGNSNCRNGIELIKRAIAFPETIGMPTLEDLFNEDVEKPGVHLHDKPSFSSILKREPGNHMWYYQDLLKFGLDSIASMAYHGAIDTFRIVLGLPEEDAKHYAIKALGKLGGTLEIELLKPFIQEREDSHLKYLAILSLTTMNDKSVYHRIVEIYFDSLQKLHSREKKNGKNAYYIHDTEWVYRASKDYLLKADPGAFEHVLLDQIKNEKTIKNKRVLLGELFYFSSEDSADLAFKLLEDKVFQDDVERILFRLSDTPKVIKRAMGMLISGLEEKRTLAFRLLNPYFRNHLEELDAVPIRNIADLKSKLDLYSYYGLWQRLLDYLSDPREDIRNYALDNLNYVPAPLVLKEYYEWFLIENTSHIKIEIELFSFEMKLILKKSSTVQVYDMDSVEMNPVQMESGKVALRLYLIEERKWMDLRLQNEDKYGENNFYAIANILKSAGKNVRLDLYKNSSEFLREDFDIEKLHGFDLDYVQWLNLWSSSTNTEEF